MLTTGVDILEIQRIGRYIDRFGDHILRHMYCPIEIRRYAAYFEQMANVFAAKEAVAKALGVGFAYMHRSGVLPVDIEITSFDRSIPRTSGQIILRDVAKQRADDLQLTRWTLAVVLLKDHTVAFVAAASTDVPLALTDATIAHLVDLSPNASYLANLA